MFPTVGNALTSHANGQSLGRCDGHARYDRLNDPQASTCGLILLNRALHFCHGGGVDARHSMGLFCVLSHFLQQFFFRRRMGFEVAIRTNVLARKTERHNAFSFFSPPQQADTMRPNCGANQSESTDNFGLPLVGRQRRLLSISGGLMRSVAASVEDSLIARSRYARTFASDCMRDVHSHLPGGTGMPDMWDPR